MLALPAAQIPEPEAAWGAEFKWDGVRAVAYVSAGRLRLLSRSGRDMTRAYPELAELGRQAGPRDMVLDGEIAAFTGGRPSFAALQRRMHAAAPTDRLVAAVPVTYLVFDIMHAGGQPLIAEPYLQRRAILEAQPLAGPHVHVPPWFPGGGKAVLAVSVRDGLEGVVVKRLDSPYQPGRRSPAWLKIKNRRLLDVAVGGVSPGRGHRAGQIGSLLVGLPGGAGLAYAGPCRHRLHPAGTAGAGGAAGPAAAPQPAVQRAGPPGPGPERDLGGTTAPHRGQLRRADPGRDPPRRRVPGGQGHRGRARRRAMRCSAAGRAHHVRAAFLRAQLIGPACLGTELIGPALLRTEDVGAPLFRAELIGTARLGAEYACVRLGLARGLGIACHVGLPHGLPFQILPGAGPPDTGCGR
jgi:hypothetical protein